LLTPAAVLLVAAVALRSWFETPLANNGQVAAGSVAPSTIIYDRHGRVLYEILDPRTGRQQSLRLADIPSYLQEATIATEDASFYSNPGVDLFSIIRAVWINLRGGEVLSGGSTITQQLARNLLLSPGERQQRTLGRKVRESILAFRLARALSKDRILELYLNQTYYGNLAYGVEAAARAYFAKPARDLDLAECALLAGLPQAPATYDPLVDPQAARNRQGIVLDLMAKRGYVSQEQARLSAEEELAFASIPFPIRAPHFVMFVWDGLLRQFGEEAILRRGLRVYTTLDVDLQERARDIVRFHLRLLAEPGSGKPPHNASGAALVALDPASGQILAMLGSPDYFSAEIDGAVNVALMPRQPGSAIKPLTYAAAFSRDYTAATMLLDIPSTFVTREDTAYVPANYDRTFRGPVLLRQALASSLNLVAVRVLDHIGLEALLSVAHDLAITTLQESQRYGLALTLGGGDVRLLELTAAYGALANGGCRVQPVGILRVEAQDGTVIWEHEDLKGTRVLDDRVAFLVTDVLADDSARIPAFGEGSALRLSRPAAAKTGTTTDWRDNWTVGYTPDLVTGVWVGNADNSPMVDVSGISGAAPIWHAFMEEALQGRPSLHFARPAGLSEAEVCSDSGLLPNALCPHRRTEIFISGTLPVAACSMHRTAEVDMRYGLLASRATPPEFRARRIIAVLPAEAAQWAREQRSASGALYFSETDVDRVEAPVNAQALCLILTSPDRNSVFRLVPSMPPLEQRVEVSAAEVSALPPSSRVELLVDGQLLGTFAEPPYSLLWQLQAGVHAFQARGVLTDGRICSSAVISITVLQ